MPDPIIHSEEVLKDVNLVETPSLEGLAVPPVVEDPAPLEIGSLAEAMQAYNKAKSKAAEPTVPGGEAGKETVPATPGEEITPPVIGGGVPAGTQGAGEPPAPDTAQAVGQTDAGAGVGETVIPGGAGEPAGYDEVYDADAGVAEVRQQLMRITADAVRAEFTKQKIRPISIRDLEKVDEKSGTKEFINPDTKRPFQSSNPRSEAQAFVNDYNNDLNVQFRQQCQALMPKVEMSYAPIIRFHQFLPTWQKMDEDRKELFETLVAGHELKDKQGNIVAYSCDLNQINNLMERQLAHYASKNPQTQTVPVVEDPVTQPAVAAKTTAHTTNTNDEEKPDLSTVEGSLKYYNKMKKARKQ